MATPALMSYFGGKNKFKSFIYPVVPKNYKTYLEPFSGSFGVYFFLDIPENAQVRFNDINIDQTNLVACSKDYDNFYKFLKNEIENPNGSLYCKETDEKLKKEYYKELYYSYKNSNFRNDDFDIPDMKRASQYAFLLTSAFSSCSYTAAGFSGFKLPTFLRKLQNVELQKKLSKITSFETLNFEDVIKKYDSEDTFIYLDPPYYEEKNKRSGWYGTKDEFGQEEHIKLLKLLKTTKSKWMLSYYYYSMLEEYLPKDEFVWLEKDFFRSSASFSENKSTKGTELLIMNYKLTDEEIEENKKFLNVKPVKKSVQKKSTVQKNNKNIKMDKEDYIDFEKELLDDDNVKKITNLISNQKDLDPKINNIVNKNFEELIDEIEEVNGGAFINSNIDGEQDVSKNIKEISDYIKGVVNNIKDDDIDDFWLK